MKLKVLFSHLVNGVCPDMPLDLELTAKGRRLVEKRRKH
jgi:hypothetical protein